MRAAALSLSILLAFACHPCSAQQAPAPSSAKPDADKSDDSLSPSTLPKARQKVTETAPRIGSLSPDEERRLGRAKGPAKGAAGEAVTPAHAAGSAAAPASQPAPATKAAAVAPATETAKPTSPARKHVATVHRDPQAHHAVREPRDTADLGMRHRARPRAVAEDRGDPVPPVFHPYPQGYGPPQEAEPLPFPGQRDEADDDFGPPRRLFAPPY